MDNEYTVGALGNLIVIESKKKKSGQVKNGNVENKRLSETDLNKLSSNKMLERTTKKKSKKDTNSLLKNKNETSETNAQHIQTNNDLGPLFSFGKIKKEKVKNQRQSEEILNKLHTDKSSEHTLKRKSKKDSKESLKKKTKKCAISSFITSNVQENTEKNLQVKTGKKSVKNQAKPAQKISTNIDTNYSPNQTKTVEKNANKRFQEDKPKILEKTNKISKLSKLKSSVEYTEKESRTVFVGNVPVGVKMKTLKSLFKKFGDIETTRLRSVAVNNINKPKRASIVKKDFHPQRDTANVYIRFKTIEQAQKALVLNATQFEGHTIRVDMALNTSHKQNKKTGIFIGNLPYNIQEDDVWSFFKDSGSISAVRIVRDNTTGVSKGFGYVDFEAKECVELALQLQGKKIQNREIRIKRIEMKNKTNKIVNKVVSNISPSFKRKNSVSWNNQKFQGETVESKMYKKKQKFTKTDIMRRKIAKQLNG